MRRAVRMPFLPVAGARPFDVLTVGLNSVDMLAVVDAYPEADSKHPLVDFLELPGGPAATTAAGLARLGWRASYIGRFGDDEYGRVGYASLAAAGVDTRHAVTVAGATSQFAVIIVDARAGTRTVLWHRHPGLRMTAGDIPPAAVSEARIVHVDCHEVEAATHAARLARAAGVPTVIDVERVQAGTDALLREIDVIVAASGFPEAFTGHPDTGAALAALQEASGARLVAVTLGKEGSLARAGGEEIRTPGFAVDVRDTTGAGDAFRAGAIAGWLTGGADASVDDVLRYANAVAALSCRRLGARDGLPTADEVQALLSSSRS